MAVWMCPSFASLGRSEAMEQSENKLAQMQNLKKMSQIKSLKVKVTLKSDGPKDWCIFMCWAGIRASIEDCSNSFADLFAI